MARIGRFSKKVGKIEVVLWQNEEEPTDLTVTIENDYFDDGLDLVMLRKLIRTLGRVADKMQALESRATLDEWVKSSKHAEKKSE